MKLINYHCSVDATKYYFSSRVVSVSNSLPNDAVDDVESAEVERRQDGIHLARHTSAVSEDQSVTAADKWPVHHAAEQSS